MTPHWSATVRVLATRSEDSRTFSYALFAAGNKWRAARQVAQWAALYLYPRVGEAGYLAMTERDTFRATVGYRTKLQPTVLTGCTIIITLTPEESTDGTQ